MPYSMIETEPIQFLQPGVPQDRLRVEKALTTQQGYSRVERNGGASDWKKRLLDFATVLGGEAATLATEVASGTELFRVL